MSKLGKIFLYIALAGAIAAVVAGVMLIAKYNDSKTNLAQAQTDKDTATKAAAKANAEKLAAVAAKAESDKNLADANSQLEKMKSDLADAQKQATDTKAAVDAAKAETAKAQADLATINDKLKGRSIEDIDAAKAKAEKDLQASQDEQKILEDQLQASGKKVADLMDAINRKDKGIIPPGISGKITFVNRTWNFVVLDVGLSNGVVPNGELIVYRKNNFLGKVKITSVEANSAVADILPDTKGDIQIGDYVLN